MAQDKIVVRTEDGKTYVVGEKLSRGGQGIVYKATCENDNKEYALKMYIADLNQEFLNSLRANIKNGAPNASFCWPKALTEPVGRNNKYGCIFDLLPNDYVSFNSVVRGRESFPTKEMQIKALINLVEALDKLHARGYCCPELSDDGVLFNLNTGDVLLTGTDNLVKCGESLGIIGKFKYMAPEVAADMFIPDEYSDRLTLAILLFYLLVHAHPYEGIKRFGDGGIISSNLKQRIYGSEAVFIFDPNNDSNRPDPEVDSLALRMWPLLPDFIQDLFIKTFTAGIPYPGAAKKDLEASRKARATDKEWIAGLEKYLALVERENK